MSYHLKLLWKVPTININNLISQINYNFCHFDEKSYIYYGETTHQVSQENIYLWLEFIMKMLQNAFKNKNKSDLL